MSEGVRGAFEYGHRNIAGDAIALTLRAQASYLPDEFILDSQVRANYDSALGRGFSDKRLASRVTASVAVPEIGLGPLVRLQVDGVYVRDLERDFALTKFAAIPGVNYRAVRELQFSLSQSFERNDVRMSPSTAATDRAEKMPIYASEGVEHLWLVDPIARTLEAFRRDGVRWLLLGTWRDDAEVRAEPFEAFLLQLAGLWAK